MWIRTQDKRRLVKCVLFEIGLEKPTIFGYAKSGGVILGEYSSKEKALKVLDEIEKTLNQIEEYQAQGEIRRGSEMTRLIKFVYQMPQDDEVKQ